jgi:hypothetical protein
LTPGFTGVVNLHADLLVRKQVTFHPQRTSHTASLLACGQVPNVGGWFWGGPNGIYLYSAEFFVETALITLTGGATPPGGVAHFNSLSPTH